MVSERYWLKFCLESSRLKLLFSMVSLLRSCAASCCTSFSLRSACLDVTCNTDMCQWQVKANTRTSVGPLPILDSNNYWQKNRNWESAVESWFLNGEITITLLSELLRSISGGGNNAEIIIFLFPHFPSDVVVIAICYRRSPYTGSSSPYIAIEFFACFSIY